jgi:hypothetical protein
MSASAPIRPGEIVSGTSADAQTGVVTDAGGPFVVGTPVAYLAWLDPALTFPTVRIVGTLDGVPGFDIPTPIDAAANGPLPYTREVGTLPPPAVAWPGTLRLQIFDAARGQLAEGTVVIVAPAPSSSSALGTTGRAHQVRRPPTLPGRMAPPTGDPARRP